MAGKKSSKERRSSSVATAIRSNRASGSQHKSVAQSQPTRPPESPTRNSRSAASRSPQAGPSRRSNNSPVAHRRQPVPLPNARLGKKTTTKPPRYRPPPRYVVEIKKLQKTTELLIPKKGFARLVREITMDMIRRYEIRYQAAALSALHAASEAYIIGVMEDSYLAALHAKRVTLMPKDIRLAYKLRGDAERY